ncbi:MAG: hypothetical protein KIT34_15370 [Cyanobacteria bacterium TGS_CYA1]|nr:hypothetical protein [Cyanobacteria bacterium TGS_CYA1]
MSDKLKIMQERLDGKEPNCDETKVELGQPPADSEPTIFKEVLVTLLPIASAS